MRRTRCLYIPFFYLWQNMVRSVKFFFLICCLSSLFLLFWSQLITNERWTVNERLVEEAIKNVEQDLRYSTLYRKVKHLPQNVKYILMWTRRDYAPFTFYEEGQRSFLKNNCSKINCYVTFDKMFFNGNYTKFHAIAFNGRNVNPYRLPSHRSPHQKYIYFNMESSDNHPICHPKFDGFFNLTATFRLDSDIPTPYVLIKDKSGKVVGPKRDMLWKIHNEGINTDYTKNKTKAASWFVSNCKARSNRTEFVKELQKALQPYGYNIDVFGKCGQMSCPKSKDDDCESLIKKDYFFYMALENAYSVDYVTEKILTALNNELVPVVYGGANYSRFLPPGSYIDGRNQKSLYHLAALMARIAHSPKEYNNYFKWKQYYTYHNPSAIENVCKICEALNDDGLMKKTTVYNRFRSWWHPNYKSRCKMKFV